MDRHFDRAVASGAWELKLVTLLTVSALLFGCANKNASEPVKTRANLIGMSRAEIIACAGPPAKAVISNRTEVLTYTSSGGQPVSGSGPLRQGQCTANLVFQRDRLTKLNYSGQPVGAATQGERCGFKLANCLKL